MSEEMKIIIALKQRAEEMLNNNYSRKIGDEEIYSIICEWKKTLDLYDKEKEKNAIFANIINNREYTWKQNYEETFNYVKDEFISKDKIREKIEEYHHKDFIKMQVCWKHDDEALKIEKVLKELLEE